MPPGLWENEPQKALSIPPQACLESLRSLRSQGASLWLCPVPLHLAHLEPQLCLPQRSSEPPDEQQPQPSPDPGPESSAPAPQSLCCPASLSRGPSCSPTKAWLPT